MSAAEFHRRLVRYGPRGLAERTLFLLLVIVGWLYGSIGAIRSGLYRRGFLPAYRATVPVVSVGNLAVGGTGKTPVVDLVVKYLLSQGRRVAVVSRGYGGRERGVGVVSAGNGPLLPPERCGDEPYLLALRNPAAIVVIARRRPAGMRLAVERFGAEVIVLDDGFQHLAAARDLDIVLLDARAPLGNGHVLPAGVLRECPSALKRGDLFLLTRCGEDLPRPEVPGLPGPLLHSRHRLHGVLLSLDGKEMPLAMLTGKSGVAFAGVADPQAFFADLAEAGLSLVDTLAFPDHAAYGTAEIKRLEMAAAKGDYLITTEKDAVKLLGRSFPVPCFRIPLRLEMLEGDRLESMLRTLLAAGGKNGHFTGSS